jgi:hypothetical protein
MCGNGQMRVALAHTGYKTGTKKNAMRKWNSWLSTVYWVRYNAHLWSNAEKKNVAKFSQMSWIWLGLRLENRQTRRIGGTDRKMTVMYMKRVRSSIYGGSNGAHILEDMQTELVTLIFLDSTLKARKKTTVNRKNYEHGWWSRTWSRCDQVWLSGNGKLRKYHGSPETNITRKGIHYNALQNLRSHIKKAHTANPCVQMVRCVSL